MSNISKYKKLDSTESELPDFNKINKKFLLK